MRIWDISPAVSEKTAVFPGDIPYNRKTGLSFENGQHLTLSSVEATLHLGAHADATIHYHPSGEGIDRRPLETYLGNCQVISVKLRPGERIHPAHLEGVKIRAARVLFRTASFPDPDRWNDDFNSLSPELIEMLAEEKVILVGIDTPSVDPFDSKALESHQALFRKNVAVLEGLILNQVKDGLYTLIALPLALKGADASPVRAILLEKDLLSR